MSEWQYTLNQLVSLLNNKEFDWEARTFSRAHQRLKVRIRNHTFIGRLKQVLLATRKLKHWLGLFRTPDEKRGKAVKKLQNTTAQLVVFVDDTLDLLVQVYCHTQPQFKVGHLIHHWLVIRSSIARLTIFFKALLVYATDLHLLLGLIQAPSSEQTRQLTDNKVTEILLKHECKPRNIEKVKDEVNKPSSDSGTSEQTIGQLIDRSTLKPKSSHVRNRG